MADSTSRSMVMGASAAAIMDVIADVEHYGEWTGQPGAAEVVSRFESDGRPAEVTFTMESGILSDTYTLAYTWDADRSVHWTLVKGRILAALDGSYVLTPAGGDTTEVTYALAVDLSIPMIGLMKRRAAKMVIDAALAGLEGHVERQ